MVIQKNNRLYEDIQDITYESPEIPHRKHFLNGHVKKQADQKFERTLLPANLKSLPRQEQLEILQTEKHRRKHGVFFMNNGQITYITGVHYYYLNYYKMKEGKYPKYRNTDRKFFWMWDYCVKHPKCYGLLFITRRREGKSTKAGCVALEYASREKNKHVGIQSKTDDDGEDFFKDFIVAPWRELPFFFSPTSNATTDPKNGGLYFYPLAKRGKAATTESGEVNNDAALYSKITYKSSVPVAYDGRALHIYIHDEIFKPQKYSSKKRWSVVKKTQFDDGKIIGKSINTSSIGEDGGFETELANEFWKDSNPNEVNAAGYTKTGLFRLFQPNWEGFNVDEYGNEDEEANKQYFKDIRSNLKGEELLIEKRVNPATIEEALTPNSDSCMYDAAVLTGTLDNINTYTDQNRGKKPYSKYDLHWTDETKTAVYAKENLVNGRFYFSWMPQRAEELNRVENRGPIQTQFGEQTLWKPLNDEKFAIGSDPIDKSITVEKRNSTPAAHGFRKFDVFNEMDTSAPNYWPSNAVIFEYLYRPKLKAEFHEDLIKACHFLGCQIFFENNKSSWYEYFENRGYGNFLASKPANTAKDAAKEASNATPGAASTPWLKQQYAEKTQNFIVQDLAQDWRRLPFPRTLNELLRFDISNTMKFDAAVSLGFTLLTAQRYIPPKPKQVAVESLNIRVREF